MGDIAQFTAEVSAQGTVDVSEAPDQAAVTGNVLDVITGKLDASEAPDHAEITLLAGLIGVLDASEAPDTIEAKVWVLPFGQCQVRTVCITAKRLKDPDLNGRRAKAPDLTASQGDKDTATCRDWSKAA